jgi:ubiquitin C-terminal hydrolase
LLENDDENYGEELDRQLEKKAPLIEQYRKNHEILSMKNGGKNDFMQSLF